MVVPTPLLVPVATPILSASKVDTEATEARAEAARSCGINPSWGGSSRVKIVGGVERVRNPSWVSPRRPAEGAGSGLWWSELKQPGYDSREGNRVAARRLETHFCPGRSGGS